MSLKSIADKFLENVEKEEEIEIHSSDLFKEKIMELIINQNSKLNRLDFVQNYILAELLRKVELHELEPNELLRLNKDLTLQKNDTIRATLDMLKPSTNSGNPLMPPAIRQEETNPIEGLSSEERQALNILTLVLQGKGDENLDAKDVTE